MAFMSLLTLALMANLAYKDEGWRKGMLDSEKAFRLGRPLLMFYRLFLAFGILAEIVPGMAALISDNSGILISMFMTTYPVTLWKWYGLGMASMIYGYARVSTGDQTTDLQKDALVKAGCDRIFTDVASGAKTHRPELDHMLDLLREDDTVVVWKLDRLGRSMQNLVDLMATFDGRGVQFRSLTEAIDTSNPGGTLVFNIFGSLAQFERDLIRERTRAGLAAALARGRKGGRPAKLDEKQVREVRRLYESKSVTVNQIAAMMDVGRSTIYRCVKDE